MPGMIQLSEETFSLVSHVEEFKARLIKRGEIQVCRRPDLLLEGG